MTSKSHLAKSSHTLLLFSNLALEGFSGVTILLEASLEFHPRYVPRLGSSQYAFWVLPSQTIQHCNNHTKDYLIREQLEIDNLTNSWCVCVSPCVEIQRRRELPILCSVWYFFEFWALPTWRWCLESELQG